jgi:preprotein translocase subunit SecG
MTLLFSILIILSAVLLILTVLAQSSKGNGLTSGFGGASQLMGTKRTTDILEKLTWGFAIALLVFSFALNITVESPEAIEGSGSVNVDRAKSAAKSQPQQTAPTAAPVEDSTK